MTTSLSTAPADMTTDHRQVDRVLLLGLVADITHTLLDEAIWSAPASSAGATCLWLGDEVVELDGAFPVIHRDLDGSLYSGSAGIGWFLAHAASALNDPAISVTAAAGLRHALDWAQETSSLSLYAGSIGVGLACLVGGRVLDDTPLESSGVDLLVEASHRATSRPPLDEPESDLISGDAGVVLGLLSAAQAIDHSGAAPSEAAVQLRSAARKIGERLISDADRGPTGWTWRPMASTEPPLCGLGHGASGPALALAELFAVTGEDQFAHASREACRSERAWFAVATDGWPDLRELTRVDLTQGTRPTSPHLWCHGSLGIGVARLQIWGATGDPAALAEATAALHFARGSLSALGGATPGEYAANFSLCHGAAGLIDFLRLAADVLEDRSWLPGAAAGVGVGLKHLAATGSWRCGVEGGPQQPTSTPGLMLGLAGTGAAILRLAEVDRSGMASPLLMVEHRSRRIIGDQSTSSRAQGAL